MNVKRPGFEPGWELARRMFGAHFAPADRPVPRLPPLQQEQAMTASDKAFTGSIPQIYDQLMVPLIFVPYALDLARRIAAYLPRDVLETAAGTGVVTRALHAQLPPEV